jgi:hypothetical protein
MIMFTFHFYTTAIYHHLDIFVSFFPPAVFTIMSRTFFHLAQQWECFVLVGRVYLLKATFKLRIYEHKKALLTPL